MIMNYVNVYQRGNPPTRTFDTVITVMPIISQVRTIGSDCHVYGPASQDYSGSIFAIRNVEDIWGFPFGWGSPKWLVYNGK